MNHATDKGHSNKPFGEALVEVVRERQALPLGRFSLRAFFQPIDGWTYDALRKMVKGTLPVTPQAMEACAAQLQLPPSYFREYRVWQIDQAMERIPEVVDILYDIAMDQLAKHPE